MTAAGHSAGEETPRFDADQCVEVRFAFRSDILAGGAHVTRAPTLHK